MTKFLKGIELRPDIYRPSQGMFDPAMVDAYSPAPPGGTTTSISGMLSLLWRHRWIILAATLAFAVGTLAIARQLTPMYSADGAIAIASRKLSVPELQTMVTPTGDAATVRSEMAVLSSRSVLRDVAARLHLDTVPEFNPQLRPKAPFWRRLLNPYTWLAWLSDDGDRTHPVDPKEVVAAHVEATLNRHLTLVNDGRDYIISVLYRGEDPRLSAAIVNTLMQRYLAQYVESMVAATVSANSSLQARADDLRRQVEDADKKVSALTAQTGTLETHFGTVSAQQVADLNTELTTARADRVAAEARYREAVEVGHSGALLASNADVLASPVIQQLRVQEAEAARNQANMAARLGPRHPDLIAANKQLHEVRAAIQREINKIVGSVGGQVNVARAREESLEGRLSSLQQAATTGAEAQDRLQQLKDDADSKRKVYDEFLIRVAQTAKPEDQPLADARVISNAVVPIMPSSPRTGLMTLLGGFVGLLLSVAGVLIHRQLDHGFEDLQEVRAVTGLPGLASLPVVRHRGLGRLQPGYVLDHPTSPFAEALRALRARLSWASHQRPIKSILVSSALPGEGKTSFALAFARLAANEGHKVLLIECDYRRPILSGIFPASTSLANPDFAADPLSWRDLIQVDPASGLSYWTAAGRAKQPLTAREADALHLIIKDAALDHDFIIVDSPPIMRVSDAMLLAQCVDAVALVVWWRHTRQRLVMEALRRLSLMPDKPTGLILTKVDARGAEQDTYAGYN